MYYYFCMYYFCKPYWYIRFNTSQNQNQWKIIIILTILLMQAIAGAKELSLPEEYTDFIVSMAK